MKQIFKNTICLLIMMLFAMGLAVAQDAIKWRTTVKMSNEKEGVLTVKAIVEPGWHLYGTKLPKNGPKPTVLDFSASKGVKFISEFSPSEKPVVKYDDMYEMELNWWSGTVSFSRKFKLTGKKEDAEINGKITFMACNDQNCLPPKTQAVKLKIK